MLTNTFKILCKDHTLKIKILNFLKNNFLIKKL